MIMSVSPGVLPGEDLQRSGGTGSGQRRGLSKLQPERVFSLQLDDDAVVDWEPVHSGNQQLTGQQAALVYQTLVGVLGGSVLPGCVTVGEYDNLTCCKMLNVCSAVCDSRAAASNDQSASITCDQ